MNQGCPQTSAEELSSTLYGGTLECCECIELG